MPAIKGTFLSILLLCVCHARAQSDRDSTRMMRSTLRDLLGEVEVVAPERALKTELADRASKDLREATGIVFVLTREEIRASGATVLQEALMLLPGISLGRDVDDVMGLAIRGNWAEEGKCLVMLNGMPMNETSFGTAGLVMRLPLYNVERIEVINGPGSVIYGGFAALGVVNVITVNGSTELGTHAVGAVAFGKEGWARNRMGLYGSHRTSDDAELDHGIFLTNEVLSDRIEQLADGTELSYADSTRSDQFNAYLEWRKRHLRCQFSTADRNFQVADRHFNVRMRDMSLKVSNQYNTGRRGTLALSVGTSWQLPWNYSNDTTLRTLALNTTNQRTTGALAWRRNFKDHLVLAIGTEGWYDRYDLSDPMPDQAFNMAPGDRVHMWDIAGYAELASHRSWGDLTAGVRAEHQDLTGDFVAPRFAYTRILGRFHGKLLYAEAFKLPTMQNIESGPSDVRIVGERVTTQEVEFGYSPTSNIRISIDAFNVELEDPIVYVYDADLLDNYVNRDGACTQGLEFMVRATGTKKGIHAALSTYRATGDPADLPEIALPDTLSRAYQGIPRHKAVVVGHMAVGRHLRAELGCIWQGEAHAYQYLDAEQTTLGLVRYAPGAVINAGLAFILPDLDGFEVNLRCSNVLDQHHFILSPYNNGSTSLPGRGREWTFTVKYRLPI